MIFIRADSNPTIAGGHIMRCLAIAQALINAGEEVCFLVADNNPMKLLEDAGVQFVVLNSNWKELMSDVEQVKQLIIKTSASVLLIDTYQITREYVEELKPYVKVVYLGSKREFLGPLDLLINYSADIDYQFYKENYSGNTDLLLGVQYAPLRKEFQNATHEYNNHLKRLFLTTGNTERNDIVTDILNAILPILIVHQIEIDVVVGRMFANKKSLHNTFDLYSNVNLHEEVKSIASLMQKCDLAISANGTTVYELSSMGIPVISFAMVEEQIKSAEALNKLGVIDYCGKSYVDKSEVITNIVGKLQYYINHNDALIQLAQKARELIDGQGCKRIAAALLKL